MARVVHSCRAGHAEACAQASEADSLPAESRQQLLAEAHDLWWSEYENGDNDACIRGAEKSRGDQHSRYLTQAARQGDGRGYWYLAQTKSDPIREGLIRKACELDYEPACEALEKVDQAHEEVEARRESIANEEILPHGAETAPWNSFVSRLDCSGRYFPIRSFESNPRSSSS